MHAYYSKSHVLCAQSFLPLPSWRREAQISSLTLYDNFQRDNELYIQLSSNTLQCARSETLLEYRVLRFPACVTSRFFSAATSPSNSELGFRLGKISQTLREVRGGEFRPLVLHPTVRALAAVEPPGSLIYDCSALGAELCNHCRLKLCVDICIRAQVDDLEAHSSHLGYMIVWSGWHN